VHHAVWAPLTAFTASLVTVWWLSRSQLADLVLDRPNERSLHARPVPRTGGIGVHLGILLAWALISPGLPYGLLISFALLLIVSFLDDARGVPIFVRLAVHLLAAGLAAASLPVTDLGIWVAVLATLAMAWMANLYNFMDGSDGLAGGMAVSGFAFYSVAAWFAGNSSFALLNLSIASAAMAFLVFNFHPARIFMGDVGSVALGFLAAALGAVGWVGSQWPWWFAPLVFSPFIVDATVTLARRALRGERVWRPHRDHYYQRLVQMGWGHRGTALAEYALMLACGGLAVLALFLPAAGQVALLGIAAVAYAGMIAAIEHAWARRSR
jgi:UDP-N-acetylmuramyl pentapeptide phosphotransferase/UDP-N-acetylglucosamine-1-phosphate transferase